MILNYGKWFFIILGIISISSDAFAQAKNKNKNYVQYVDPYIGSKGHGHVFVGANVPSGAVQLGPTCLPHYKDKFGGWDWCSGYNYISEEVVGFAHTHLSGTGIGDLNDLLMLPATGELQLKPMTIGNENSGYGASFTKEQEKVKPGFYELYLRKYGVQARLTATERVGLHQYRFDKKDNAHILIDLGFSILWDKAMDTYFEKINDSTIYGFRHSKGWANDQRLFFAIRTSQPLRDLKLYDSTSLQPGVISHGTKSIAALFFNVEKNNTVAVKVGISPVSSENAMLNIDTETKGWNFDGVVDMAVNKWNNALGKIDIEASDATKTIFYTALYHSLFCPSIFNDINGEYRMANKTVAKNPGFANYSLFSLWDTYRALNPLYTIAYPEKMNDIIRSFLSIYKTQGYLPVWHFQACETNTMVGYPAVPIVTDAYLKGFRDYDVSLAYEAVKTSAMRQVNGIKFVKDLQYIPADSMGESVAWAMEYAIADWGIAQMAKALGHKADYEYFSQRYQLYKKYYDHQDGFMKGRLAAQSWRTPFSPFSANHRANDYCEGNGWQYTWLAPQDAYGLIDLMGGDEKFAKKLDELFNAPSALLSDASPDISGMIGQYAHGNEPNHHTPYLYVYAGQQWKTAALVRKIADTFYTAKPDGLCGNEDAGQMSAWYNLSALGFYSVNPMSGVYVLGSPLVSKARIQMPKGKWFTVNTVNQSTDNLFIQSATFNGKPYNKSYITHSMLKKGGTLTLTMGNKPNVNFGADRDSRPAIIDMGKN